jgi:hypothetical protein
MDDSSEVLQQNVQRHLGRCMLRLQQYERLLKSMVANMAVKGRFEQLQAKRVWYARSHRGNHGSEGTDAPVD